MIDTINNKKGKNGFVNLFTSSKIKSASPARGYIGELEDEYQIFN